MLTKLVYKVWHQIFEPLSNMSTSSSGFPALALSNELWEVVSSPAAFKYSNLKVSLSPLEFLGFS